MTDNELMGVILTKFYERRREGNIIPKPEDFYPPIPSEDLFRICEQLGHHGLLLWESSPTGGNLFFGSGKISAYGVDVIENNEKPPIAIMLQNISISQSQGVQIGNGNVQNISNVIEQLIWRIDNSNYTEAEKIEAKSRLKSFLEHPLVTSIIGGLAGGLVKNIGG